MFDIRVRQLVLKQNGHFTKRSADGMNGVNVSGSENESANVVQRGLIWLEQPLC